MDPQPAHTTERHVIGELDRRRAEEREALEAVAAMKVADMPEAARALREEVKERTGKKRPKPDEVVETAADLPESQRHAVVEAVNPDEPKEATS